MEQKITSEAGTAMPRILDILQEKHGAAVFHRWFSQLRLSEKNQTCVTLLAPNEYLAQQIGCRYGFPHLIEAVQCVWPEINCVKIGAAAKRVPYQRPSPAQGRLELAA